jgi:hypothetical protein
VQVCALLGGGAYAEKVNVPAVQPFPVPKGITLRDAAAIPEVASTVWSTVFMTCHLKKGETLLVQHCRIPIWLRVTSFAISISESVLAMLCSARRFYESEVCGLVVVLRGWEWGWWCRFTVEVVASAHSPSRLPRLKVQRCWLLPVRDNSDSFSLL